ncbi:cytochrome c3-like protein [Thermovibrio guaymasensis]|uniref:Cytochrome c3-like protein n=1 Tax=Thermovibrio guaymasensis TaxID=240167 RepID=A0A420W7U3_9BACT|nr:cytochrome c3 family protein [Thermovibrio guaymasensis]RKQ63374.1 cytochrome c3-like protein [Thermovibrio guaymasensis]
MRSLLTVTTAVFILTTFNQALAQHPPITLVDVNGNPILNENGKVQSKLPVSYQKSCKGCHNLDYINMGWHSQQGRLSTLSAEVYKQVYEKFGEKSTLPKDQSGLYLKWYGPKNIYGPGGMYNRVSVPHMFKLAPYKTTDPLDINFTTAEWNTGKCSICHPGGGFGLKDQMEQPLDKMDPKYVENALKNGIYYGDYLVDGPNGTLKVFDYHAKAGDTVVPNVRDNDCLVCHAYSYDLGNARMTSWKKKHPGWVDTVGAGLGSINPDWTVNYDKDKVSKFHYLIRGTTNESCSRCHAGVYDINADGKITPYDNIGLFGDIYLLTSPGFFKRAQEIGDVGEIGSDNLPHKVIDDSKRPEFFNPKTGQWEKVPYLDVHAQGGMKCADCHRQVKSDALELQYVQPSWMPSHDVAKGTDGFNVRSDLSGTTTCIMCHTDYKEIHKGAFPENIADVHLKYIHCTTCHIPQKFNGVIQTLIRTTEEGKGHLFWNFDEEHDATVPFYPDYVWFPHVPAKGETPVLKIKPANSIAELYWRLSDGRGVPNRFLHMVFKVSPDTWNTSNPDRPEAEFGLIYFKDGKPYKPAKALNNKYVVPGGMVYWAYVGKYGDTVEFPDADSVGIPKEAPIVGRFNSDGTVNWINSNTKSGWVVKSTLPNMLENPETGETMIIRKDEAEAPFVDEEDEIKFAASALEAAIKKVTGKDVKVQYVYHLGILDGSYIMSHNVAPVSSQPMQSGGDAEFSDNPLHVLQCQDCHSSRGKFNRAIKKYPHIDTVPGVTVFEVPKAAIEGYNGEFTEADLRKLTFAYYSPVDVQVFPPEDGNAVITKVWTPSGGDVEPTGADSIDTSFVPNGYTVKQAMTFNLNNGNSTTFEVLPLEGKATDYEVFGTPSSAVSYTVENDGKIKVTLTATKGSEITVAIAKKASTSAQGETQTGGGGDSGGCSISPSSGIGGVVSSLLALLPLGFLRLKRRKND